MAEPMASRIIWMSAAALAALALQAAAADPPRVARLAEPRVRSLRFSYEVKVRDVPAGASSAYLWLPYPPETAEQTVEDLVVDSRLEHEVVSEARYGNRALRFQLRPGPAEQKVSVSFDVTRRELVNRPAAAARSSNGASPAELALWLEPDRRVPLDDQVRSWARQAVGERTQPLQRARAIYDYTVTSLKYDKTGTGWGQGDIYWACDAKRGNCTDFHAVFIGYARALGIPARFEIGFPLPPERGEGELPGYHCWAFFHLAGQGWIPVDASEAHKHPDKRDYFFGALDENRVVFTTGRDLVFPGMKAAPINYFIYPHAEVDGRPHAAIERRVTYRDLD